MRGDRGRSMHACSRCRAREGLEYLAREPRPRKDKVRRRDGGSDSLMLSGHQEMCVTQSQIGNRCSNLASLRGYPLR